VLFIPPIFLVLIPLALCPQLASVFDVADSQTISAALTALLAYICVLTFLYGTFQSILRISLSAFTHFAASIIFPRFLALHQLFSSFLPRRLYHRTHVSRMRADRFERLVHRGSFTIFVLGVSSKSVPIRECSTNIFMAILFTFLLISCQRSNNSQRYIDYLATAWPFPPQ